MRLLLIFSFFVLAQVCCLAEAPVWLTDWEEAKKSAQKQSRPILVNFTGSDWCSWCIKLKKEVFSQKEFLQYAENSLVLLEIDFPSKKKQSDALKKQNQELVKKYEVKGYPTILLLDANGKLIAATGYRKGGAEAYVQHLQEISLGGSWMDNFEEAQKKARKEVKYILADFTGSDWCFWCVRLDQEVFAKKEFLEYASKNFVLLKLDFPSKKKLPEKIRQQNEKLAKMYEVEGYPTVLILHPDGEVVARTGYEAGGVQKYIEHLEKLLHD